MKRHVLIYGLVGGILIAVLKWTEYRFLVIEYSLEIYGGLIAAIFAVLGIWLGLKLTETKQTRGCEGSAGPGWRTLRSWTRKNERGSASRAASLKFSN